MICRDYEPRGVPRAAPPDRLGVGVHVLLPVRAFLEVLRRDLPMLLGVVNAFLEPLDLLVAADVEGRT